jgi:exonuclease SbcC
LDLHKIRVENFRCFEGEHELDISEGPLWIVRGENGSGKSTIVCDAILFTLFNTLPSIEGTQSLNKTDLINVRSKSMSVQIWFNHNGRNYRMKRSYKLKGKSTNLDHQFEVWENGKILADIPRQEESKNWISEKFWDVEDFRNTTIILQKEITNCIGQKESERKKSIEKIFNIERFTEMSKLAHEHARETSNDIKSLVNVLETIKKGIISDQDLQEKKFTFQEKLTSTKQKSVDRQDQLNNKKSIRENLEKVISKGEVLKSQIMERGNQIVKNTESKKEFEKQLLLITSEISKEDEYKTQLLDIENLEKDLEQRKDLKQEIQNKNQNFSTIEKIIETAYNSLVNDKNSYEQSHRKIIQQIGNLKIELDDLHKKQVLIRDLEKEVKDLQTKPQQKNSLVIELEKFETEEKSLISKINNIENLQKTMNEKFIELTNKEKSLEEKKVIFKKFEQEHSEIKEKLLALSNVQKQLEELQKQSYNCREELIKVENELIHISTSKIEIENEIKEYKTLQPGKTCPKCKQILDTSHIRQITASNEEKLTNLNIKIKKEEENKRTLETKHEELDSFLKKKKNEFLDFQKFEKNELKLQVEKKNISDQIQKLSSEIQPLLSIRTQFDKVKEEENLSSEKAKLTSISSKIKSSKTQLVTLENDILQLTKKNEQLLGLKDSVKSVPDKENILKSLSSEEEETKKLIINKNEKIVKKEYASDEQKQLETLKKEILELQTKFNNLQALEEKLKTLKPEYVRKKLTEVQGQKIIKEERIKAIKILELTIQEILADKQKLEKDFSALEIDKISIDLKKFKNEISMLETENIELIKLITEIEKDLQHTEEEIQKNNLLINEHKTKTNEYKLLKRKKDDYEVLEGAFKEIGKRILNRVMTKINLYSTEILSRLGNDQLEQITLNETKSGFELKIISGGEERYPNWFSGGQQVRIGLAFRLSLSKTLAEVTGGDIETILIDEGDFGALDTQGLKGVAEILNDLKQYFKRIVIITHMDRLANELEGSKLLVKDNKLIAEL